MCSGNQSAVWEKQCFRVVRLKWSGPMESCHRPAWDIAIPPLAIRHSNPLPMGTLASYCTAHTKRTARYNPSRGLDSICALHRQLVVFALGPDPCSSGRMNYCDVNAECMPSSRSFTCKCKDGYKDASFNPRETPGERCQCKFNVFKNYFLVGKL